MKKDFWKCLKWKNHCDCEYPIWNEFEYEKDGNGEIMISEK